MTVSTLNNKVGDLISQFEAEHSCVVEFYKCEPEFSTTPMGKKLVVNRNFKVVVS